MKIITVNPYEGKAKSSAHLPGAVLDTTHLVYEDVGMGPQNIVINFRNPGDMGFDTSKSAPMPVPLLFVPTVRSSCVISSTHRGGVELRTRFWMGWTVRNKKHISAPPMDAHAEEP